MHCGWAEVSYCTQYHAGCSTILDSNKWRGVKVVCEAFDVGNHNTFLRVVGMTIAL